MAEASPIGRGKNLTLETILSFLDAIPLESMQKNIFLAFGEARMKGWRQTHSQIARQLALYYEDENGICHPRFKNRITPEEAASYGCNWARKYFAPNPFTPSLAQFKGKETNIYAFVRQKVTEGEISFSGICQKLFNTDLNNLDKVRVYLSNFTDLIISEDKVSINDSVLDSKFEEIHPSINCESTIEYYHHFDYKVQSSKGNKELIPIRPLQQIYFGAPGTGKSHRIKQVCREYEHYRITFHPDTDYASFVGSYKPITHSEQVYTNMGDKAIPLKDSVTGEPVTTTKITYQYVYQAFLNAYIAAWKEQQKENPQPVFLVIEEINRGNCAQIFGDIFQLLDRNESGFSDYPIIADNDLKKELAREFESLDVLNADNINGIYGNDIIAKIKSGSHLLLPNNLYIWATMNTSDQSLFPIDSAFKRRWEWKYVKIADSGKGYRIAVNGNEYDWWEFVEAINSHIGTDTDQEDKKLGYFFAKAKKNDEGKYIISADTFLSKVIFFIYNDVYKDFDLDDDIFKDEDGQVLTFANYFDQYGDTVPEKVERFIQNLGLKPISSSDEDIAIEEMFDDSTSSENREIIVNGISSSRNNSFTAITKVALDQSVANGNPLTIDDLIKIAQSSFLTKSGKQMKKAFFLKDEDKDEYFASSTDKTAKDRYKFQFPLVDSEGVKFYAWSDWGEKEEPSLARYANALNVKAEGFNKQ